MKITNALHLPQAIVDAVTNDGYSKGDADISVTTLVGPPRQRVLEKKHHDDITEDASNRIWSLLGQSIHTILERANKTGIAERRLSIEVKGWKISGGMDLFDEEGILTDYKTTSVWAIVLGGKEDWINQLNVYAEILRSHGHEVKGLKIVALLRDWSSRRASQEFDYPETQVVVVPLTLWSSEKAKKYIEDRVSAHQQAEIELPNCTEAERWSTKTVFAVMKKGTKRAERLHDSLQGAEEHVKLNPSLYTIVRRTGEPVRCGRYCRVSKFCTQYQSLTLGVENPKNDGGIINVF